MPFTPNHQQKVNDCYPKKEGEGTVSGKLSSLIYYINARPQKLVKVALYISTKVAKDIERQNDCYNNVTLDIVDSIMKNCSNYFESFCPYALSIVYSTIQSNSYFLALRSLQTFSEFCSRSKNIISTFHDDSFFRKLNELTSYFSKHCVRNQDSELNPNGERWQAFGFQGLNLVINLEDFKNDNGTKRVKIVIETFWSIMKNYSEILPSSTEKAPSDIQNISEIGQKCSLTLANLLSKTTAITLPIVISALIDVCDRNNWAPKSLCLYIFGSLAMNVPSQFLFVVISSIFKHLESIKYHEPTYISLLFAIYQILQTNRSPLGFSAIELSVNILSRAKIATSCSSITLPVILSIETISFLPESVSMCLYCMLAVFHNNAFLTQRYDILTYVLRKNFKLTLAQSNCHDMNRELSFSDRHSIITETVNPISFQFLQIIWIFLAGVFSESPKISKFSLIQSPAGFFEKIFYILSIDDRDTSVNCLNVICLMLNHGSVNIKELIKIETSMYHLDQILNKIFDCLIFDSSSLPHFVFSYRILKTISKLSKHCWIRTVSMIRTLRTEIYTSDHSKVTYCTFIESLLIQVFSESYSRIDTIEFKEILSEISDCQVYVDLFENGHVSSLNKSFGENHFEFELDSNLILRTYRNIRLFTVEECSNIISNFSPISFDQRDKSLKNEGKQLLSFQDSFKNQPNRNLELSAKRSILSINFGSNSSKSIKNSNARFSPDTIYSSEDLTEHQVSEASLFIDSSSSVNVLASEFDVLSLQAKADNSSKNIRKTLLE